MGGLVVLLIMWLRRKRYSGKGLSMSGSVLEMAEWFDLPHDAENKVKLRPLSRLERVRYINPHIPASVTGMSEDPPELVEAMLSLGIVDWTLTGADGEKLPLTDEYKVSLDDRTFMFAYETITAATYRLQGEANGSGTKSSTGPNRRNSRKLST